MSQIIDLLALEILDSRGNPTVQVECWTAEGGYGKAKVPSGASTGSNEALELRDQDENRFQGKGVLTAVSKVNEVIAPELIGLNVGDQTEIDQLMIKLDNSPNKANLGANAILGVSLAVAKAAADELDLPLYRYIGGTNGKVLPVPMLNVINGGAHADNTIDFQEFMIVPVGATSFSVAIQSSAEVFHTLKQILHKAGYQTTVGDEGGFAPNLKTVEEGLDVLVAAITKAGYQIGSQGFMIALDVAASEFYNKKTKTYDYAGETKALKKDILIKKTTAEQVAYLAELTNKYPIISIEDGFDENDWTGFSALQSKIGHKCQLVGDDLFVTNLKYVKKGVSLKAANAVLIKLNQIGSLTETLDTIAYTHRHGWKCIVSHRSGETSDTTIADLAVALNTGQIKTGSMSRSDRVAKYNRLLEIAHVLGNEAVYLGIKAFAVNVEDNSSSNKTE